MRDQCSTAPDRASLIHAKFTQVIRSIAEGGPAQELLLSIYPGVSSEGLQMIEHPASL